MATAMTAALEKLGSSLQVVLQMKVESGRIAQLARMEGILSQSVRFEMHSLSPFSTICVGFKAVALISAATDLEVATGNITVT